MMLSQAFGSLFFLFEWPQEFASYKSATISQHLFESNLSNYYYLSRSKYYFHLLPISAKREDKVLLKC